MREVTSEQKSSQCGTHIENSALSANLCQDDDEPAEATQASKPHGSSYMKWSNSPEVAFFLNTLFPRRL